MTNPTRLIVRICAILIACVVIPSQANAGFAMGYILGQSSGRSQCDDTYEKLVKCYEKEIQDKVWAGKDPKKIIYYCHLLVEK